MSGALQLLRFSLGRFTSCANAPAPIAALFLMLGFVLTGCHTPHFAQNTNSGCDCFALSEGGCDTCPPLIGHGLPRPPGNLLGRLHKQNFVARKIADHKEAKAAPPWPHFHPLPTHPAFYPEPVSQDSLHPGVYGEFESAE